MSKSVCRGIAVDPWVSMLAGRLIMIVISRSVVLNIVSESRTSKSTQLKIGRVDRVGVALDSFCSAD